MSLKTQLVKGRQKGHERKIVWVRPTGARVDYRTRVREVWRWSAAFTPRLCLFLISAREWAVRWDATRESVVVRILIVDDEPQIRRILRVTLAAKGYEVMEAASGEDAL